MWTARLRRLTPGILPVIGCYVLAAAAAAQAPAADAASQIPQRSVLASFILVAAPLLLLQTMLIAGLLVQVRRLRRVERELRESEKRYALATVAGAAGVWDWNLETGDIYVDPELKALLGYANDEIPNRATDWGAKVHPEDAGVTFARATDCIEGRAEGYEVEHRMVHKDGTIRWFLTRGTVIRHPNGTPHRMIGTGTDITARRRAEHALSENQAALRTSYEQIKDLAGRLITVQEAERTRIARDLHDDVSQQLAGLSISLSGLKQRLRTAYDDDDLQESLTMLQQRTYSLAANIRGLSHDLHPGVLQHAGLVPALKDHCGEFERRQNIALLFHADDDLGTIDPHTALCFYRVAQEALTNVARHARASRVHVRLTRADDEIELCVEDNGVGFDSTRDRRQARGLGLRSIDERVRIAKGTLILDSHPDRGTALRVQIPVRGGALGIARV